MAKKIRIIPELDESKLRKQLNSIGKKREKVKVDLDATSINNANRNMRQLNTTVTNSNTIFGKLRSAISNTFSSGKIAMTSYLLVLNEINKAGKNAKQTIKDIDKAITDLSIATNMSRESTAGLVKEYNNYAKELKSTTTQITSAADDYLRAGKSMSETKALIENSVMLSKLGQLETPEATEDLLATMNGYNMSIEEVGSSLDAMVAIDMKAATSAGDIATALKYSASSADMAGLSFNKLAAIIGSVQDKTQQSAETVGTFMNTLLSRYRNVKIGQFVSDDGEDLSDVETILESIDIKLRDSSQEFRNFELVIDEVASKWQSYSSVQQASIAKAFSGTRQQNRFIALMEGYGKVLELTEVAADSAGTALEKFSNSYTNSLEAKQNTLKASFESMVINSDMEEVYSGIIDATNALVEFINQTNALKGIMSGITIGFGIKAFLSIKAAINQSYISLNKFSNALKIAKQTRISTRDFDKLLLLTNGLSDSQMKMILSSKALTLKQKELLLVNSGLSVEEAKLKMQTLGLTTAQTGLTVATTSLKNAFKGLFASMLANPLMTITMVISGVVMAYQSYNQKLEETRQKSIETSKLAIENANNLEELYIKYAKLSSIQNKTNSEEEDFNQVIQDVTKTLGEKADALEKLKTGTSEYSKELKEATKAELENQYVSAKIGAESAKEELESATYDNWNGNKVLINPNKWDKDEEHVAALEIVEPILSDYEDIDHNGNIHWEPIGWDEDRHDMKQVIEYYNALVEARSKLVTDDNSDFLMSSDIYDNINSTINELSESVENYTKQQYSVLKLHYEWQNGIPTTEEEFKKMEKSILDASNAGDSFMETIKGYLKEDFSKILEPITTEKDDTSSPDTLISFASAWNSASEDTRDKLLELAKSGELTPETLESTEDYKELLAQTGLEADELIKRITKLLTTSDKLSAFVGNMKSLSTAYTDFKDSKFVSMDNIDSMKEVFGDLSSFENFTTIAGSSKSSAKEIQQAFNDLATEYLHSSKILDEVTEGNKGLIETQLKAIGVENAHELVLDRLNANKQALANKDKAIIAFTKDVKNGTLEASNAFLEEANMTDLAKFALVDLIAQQQIFNEDAGLSVDEQINSLEKLALAYMGTAAQASFLNKVQGGLNANYRISAEEAWAQTLDEFAKISDTEVKVTQSKADKDKSSKSSKSKSSEVFDWIEIRLEKLAKKTDKLKQKFEDAFSLKGIKNTFTNTMKAINKEISANEKAYDKYLAKANSVNINSSIKKKVQEGSFDISTVKNEKLKEKIEKYQTWWDKAQACKEKVEELHQLESELPMEYGDKIIDNYDTRNELNKAKISNYNSALELYDAQGIDITSDRYRNAQNGVLDESEDELKNRKNALKDYENWYKENKKNLTKADKEASLQNIENLKNEVNEAEKAVIDAQKAINETDLKVLQWDNDEIQNDIDTLEGEIAKKEAKGIGASKKDYQDRIKLSEESVENLVRQNGLLKAQQEGLEENSEEYQNLQSDINANNQAIQDAEQSQIEWNNAVRNMDLENLKTVGELLDAANSKYEKLKTLAESHGNDLSDEKIAEWLKGTLSSLDNLNGQRAEVLENIQNNIADLGLTPEQQAHLSELINFGDIDQIDSYLKSMNYSTAQTSALTEGLKELFSLEGSVLDTIIEAEEINDMFYDKLINEANEYIDSLQKEKDIKDRILATEKARFELEKAKANLTKKIWNGEQWIYTADKEAIQSAQEAFDNNQFDNLISAIEDWINAFEEFKKDDNLFDDDGNPLFTKENLEKAISEIITKDGVVLKKVDGLLPGIDGNMINVSKFDFSNFVLPNYTMPQINLPAVESARNNSVNINGGVNISLPNINDASTARDLAEGLRNELLGLGVYAKQFDWNK